MYARCCCFLQHVVYVVLQSPLEMFSLFCDVYSVQSMKQMVVKVVDNLVIFESIFWTNGITGNRLDI